MQALKKQLKPSLALFLLSGLFAAHSVMAESDQAMYLKAREMQQQHVDHANHEKTANTGVDYHGVFYGYLPCSDCAGIKTTLSLKQHSNYLLVTQPARDSAREYYEKGKYVWDDLNKKVTLTSKKGEKKEYLIEEDGTMLSQLKEDGTKMAENGSHILRRSDAVKTREVHIH